MSNRDYRYDSDLEKACEAIQKLSFADMIRLCERLRHFTPGAQGHGEVEPHVLAAALTSACEEIAQSEEQARIEWKAQNVAG